MVHRPSDSRLLSNLISSEKDYSKHLLILLDDYSHPSLSSFSAYASSSPPPTSNAILAVAGSLAGADDALRRYVQAVDGWRERLRELKDMEEDVGTVMRDREILVTRLIKASKSKPNRDSFVGPSTALTAATSSLSLKSDFSSPSFPTTIPTPTSPIPNNLNPSSKLSAAQAELQACEAHLAQKERELEEKRESVVRDGLGDRCKAMVECGWVWGEMGREALRALMGEEARVGHDLTPRPQSTLHTQSRPQSQSQFHKPLPDLTTPTPTPGPVPAPVPVPVAVTEPHRRTSSDADASSLAPSQSASNIATATALPSSSTPNGDAYYTPEEHEEKQEQEGEGEGEPPTTHTPKHEHEHEQTPPASTPMPVHNARILHTSRRPGNTRRITEESDDDEPAGVGGEGGSSEEEERQRGEISVVDNPRYASGGVIGVSAIGGAGAGAGKGIGIGGIGEGFSIRSGKKVGFPGGARAGGASSDAVMNEKVHAPVPVLGKLSSLTGWYQVEAVGMGALV